jgi:hypothetical protein
VSALSTALLSAVVAAFVTLLIEYFVKPSMEARKDRILARYRREREAIDNLDDGLFLIGRLLAQGEPDVGDPMLMRSSIAAKAVPYLS